MTPRDAPARPAGKQGGPDAVCVRAVFPWGPAALEVFAKRLGVHHAAGGIGQITTRPSSSRAWAVSPGMQGAVQQFLRHRVLHLGLDSPAQGPGAVERVKPGLRQLLQGFRSDLQGHPQPFRPAADRLQHLPGNELDILLGELAEDDDLVDPV